MLLWYSCQVKCSNKSIWLLARVVYKYLESLPLCNGWDNFLTFCLPYCYSWTFEVHNFSALHSSSWISIPTGGVQSFVIDKIKLLFVSGLAFHASLLHNLWTLLSNLGSSTTSGRIKLFIDSMISQRSGTLPAGSAGNSDIHLNTVTSILTLFCDAAIMLFM